MARIDSATIISLIQDVVPERAVEVDPDTFLIEEEILDSLAIFSLVDHLAAVHGVEVPPERITAVNFSSVNHIVAMLASESG